MERLQKKIELKAYEYFIERGMAHGNDVGDWLRAEKDILKGNNSIANKMSKKVSLKKK